MPIVLGVDLGTTKITCIAVDTASSNVLAVGTAANDAKMTVAEGGTQGHSEWDAAKILSAAQRCILSVTKQLAGRMTDVAGVGITGQQHGVVLVDVASLNPVSPLINWQDRRALEIMPELGLTWLTAAREAIGRDAWKRTGCWLQPGFMAVTLFEMARRASLPANAKALFIMDYFAAVLTGQTPVSEPSCAGSSGVFDAECRQWNDAAIEALGLSRSLFPDVHEAYHIVGGVTAEQSQATGLVAGTPVVIPIGDHQASFLGSICDRQKSILVNVGTGAQVAVYTERCEFVAPIELRPFPFGGNLLSNVGLAGGWSYQILEQFFEDVGSALFEIPHGKPLYDVMTRLAVSVPSGADGLRCEPRFSGTRLDPTVRGSVVGLSPQNFTARHFARAVLEGMARSLHEGFQAIDAITKRPFSSLIAAGNGLRENPLLAEIVAANFGLPLIYRRHREEAAFGAALAASVSLRCFSNVDEASQAMIVTADEESKRP